MCAVLIDLRKACDSLPVDLLTVEPEVLVLKLKSIIVNFELHFKSKASTKSVTT